MPRLKTFYEAGRGFSGKQDHIFGTLLQTLI
jgi:hypothetical protein